MSSTYKFELTYKKIVQFVASDLQSAQIKAKTTLCDHERPCNVYLLEEIKEEPKKALYVSLDDTRKLISRLDEEIECAKCGKIIKIAESSVSDQEENNGTHGLICRDCAVKERGNQK